MIAFHIALILLGKVWIQLFSLQLWVNSRTGCFFSLGEANSLGEGKLWNQTGQTPLKNWPCVISCLNGGVGKLWYDIIPVAWYRTITRCISSNVYAPPNECPGYEIKLSDGETQVMLDLWGMPNTHSLSLFPGPLLPGVVAPGRLLSMSQIE